MGKIFSIITDDSFFDVLAQHVFSEYSTKEISELKIIIPCKADVIALLNAFKNCNSKGCIILPEIISFENIDEEDLILNLDKIEVINPTKRILLLIEFILKWNEENNGNLPIDLAYDLSSLLNTIQTMGSCEDLQKSENFIELLLKSWSKTLKDLGVMDILEHKNNYINNMVLSLEDNQRIIFVGIGKNEICKSLIQAIHHLPHGKVILPNLNLKIKEKDWQSLDKKHYQYCLKSLLDYLNTSRNNIEFLGTECDKMIDYAFDTTADLSKVSSQNTYDKVEIITCESEEEEAQVISLITKNEGSENVSFFISNQLLATRVECLLEQNNIEDYPYITLLLYSIELLTSNWKSVELLSLLKHTLVTFGYTREEYSKILSEFEIEILRNFSISDLAGIINIINKHKKIKYKEDILMIINKLKEIYNPLLDMMNCSIFEVAKAHLRCVDMLSDSHFNNEFMTHFLAACKDIKIKCSLELYRKILTLFLKKHFSTKANNLSLHKNKVVIITDFNEAPKNSFLNSLMGDAQEEQGYFLYTLYNLFCAPKIYVTRSLNHRKSILLQRIEMMFQTKQPYRDWLKMLNTPEYVLPCMQPTPTPNAEVRKKKMQTISCSAVEKLIRNPYSFYVEHILNLKKLRDLNFKPSILEFGILAHNIFEQYSRKKDNDCMNIAKKEFFSSHFNFSNMWWIRLQKIILSFVKLDKTRNQCIEAEKSFSLFISEEISLTAKCDRVEHLPDNQAAITDYKIGSPPSNDEVMSGFFPQLILQALGVEYTTKKKVSELAYWKFDYDQISITSLQGYREKMQEFQDVLPIFLSNYLNENTPFIASPYLDKFLRFNSYAHLERIKEWL